LPSATEATIKLWELASGKLLRRLSGPKGQGQDAMLVHLSFTPDGKSLACVSREGKTVFVNLESGTVRDALKTQNGQRYGKVAVSADGKLLATADSIEGIQLWDTGAGTLIRGLDDQPKGRVAAVTFAPDSKKLACGFENFVCVFDTATGKLL